MRSAVRMNIILGGALALTLGFGSARVGAQSGTSPAFNLPNPYREIKDWLQMPPGRSLGAMSAIEIDKDGKSVWLFERCGGLRDAGRGPACADSAVAPLMKFDASGKLVASLGAGLFAHPHGIHIDRAGNIWVVDGQDKNGKGQQVLKMSVDGNVLLRLGTAGVAGEGPNMFNRPTDVAVASNGDIFVTDGHGGETNHRVVKFSKDGKFIKAWGRKGTGPGEFNTPHSIVIDPKGRVLVADRANNRIQIFDQEGTFLAEWKQFGNPAGLYIDRNGLLYATGDPEGAPAYPVGQQGVTIGTVSDGKVLYFVPDNDPRGTTKENLDQPREGVAIDRDGIMYVTKTGAVAGVPKFVKQTPTTR